ncbi:hypothetical protein T439DRAFT_352351 [Meredithblackwellia eburnea MCA 4105]
MESRGDFPFDGGQALSGGEQASHTILVSILVPLTAGFGLLAIALYYWVWKAVQRAEQRRIEQRRPGFSSRGSVHWSDDDDTLVNQPLTVSVQRGAASAVDAGVPRAYQLGGLPPETAADIEVDRRSSTANRGWRGWREWGGGFFNSFSVGTRGGSQDMNQQSFVSPMFSASAAQASPSASA